MRLAGAGGHDDAVAQQLVDPGIGLVEGMAEHGQGLIDAEARRRHQFRRDAPPPQEGLQQFVLHGAVLLAPAPVAKIGIAHFLEQTDDAILRFPFAACAIGHVVLPRRQGASCP